MPDVTTPSGSEPDRERPTTFVSRTYGRGAKDPMPTREMPVMPEPQAPVDREQPAEAPLSEPATTRRKPPRPRTLLRWLVVLLGVWLVYLVTVGLVAYFRIDSVDAKPDGGRPADGPGRNYLLVGSDSRDDLTPEQQAELGTGDVEGRRTDTILLMHVPDGGGETVLMSIPRDSLVEIPGRGREQDQRRVRIWRP